MQFMQDRKNDANDIFSATVGYGAGAKARVGPINVGLLVQEDNRLGFKNGCNFSPKTLNKGPRLLDMTSTLISYEKFSSDFNYIVAERGKFYETRGYGGLAWAEILGPTEHPWNQLLPYYTQMDVVVAPGGAVRLGFNPGELLDFIIGWTAVDLFADDINASKQKTTSNHTPKASR